MSAHSLAEMRREYDRDGLTEAAAGDDPIHLFSTWLKQAIEAGIDEPNAMTLATATQDGRPSARIVLLKGASEAGFTFFTNYEGRKAREIAVNPHAALCIHWSELSRQVRVEGVVAKVSPAESDLYFASRPLESRLSAWASRQSEPIADRSILEQAMARCRDRFAGGEVPRPDAWGGYLLRPATIEFWQGRPSRLHDRFLYTRQPVAWSRVRLSP